MKMVMLVKFFHFILKKYGKWVLKMRVNPEYLHVLMNLIINYLLLSSKNNYYSITESLCYAHATKAKRMLP